MYKFKKSKYEYKFIDLFKIFFKRDKLSTNNNFCPVIHSIFSKQILKNFSSKSLNNFFPTTNITNHKHLDPKPWLAPKNPGIK